MKDVINSQFKRYTRLAQMGALLAGEQHLPRLYDLIVSEALALTNAQMGTLLIREGDVLAPMSTRTDMSLDSEDLLAFVTSRFTLQPDSLCGQVILEDKIFNLADIRTLPEGSPAALWPEFVHLKSDQLRSLLALPLKTPQSGYIGVLMLLNARSVDEQVGPFDAQIEEMMLAVAAQFALAIQNVRWTQELHQAYQDTLYRLSLVAKYREDPSGAQIRRVSRYSGFLAGALGLPEEKVEKIRVASALYDIGKLGIPEAILLKPGRLTPEEFDRMKQHTTLGAVILGGSKTEILQIAERIALSHHEKFDGSGYPSKQAGEDIPLEGRIVALAEVFDALTTDRPYKEPMPFDAAVETIRAESGKHFDPAVVQSFLKIKHEFEKILQTVKA
jgi:HD-GYP domain-containing protein (c-di-GMP phosphodiesterase class II)